MASEIKVDTISEKTSANGIAIDSVTLKDGGATLTAPLILADGSASAPTITNTGDTNCGLLFSAADTMAFSAGGTSQFTMADGVIAPVTDNDVDIGTSSLEFKDGYFDGTLYCDVLNLAGTNHTSISAGLTGIDDQSSSNDDQITISDTAVIINEDSDDLDFRVESNGNANMLFISGGNDVVGIGAEGDLGVGLHIRSADSSADVHANADELVIEGSGHSGLSILSGNDSGGRVYFGDDGDNDIGAIVYHHADNSMTFTTSAAERARILSAGEFNIFGSSAGSPSVNMSVGHGGGSHKSLGIHHSGSGVTSLGTLVCYIQNNGNILNANNSYGSSSDERIKQDITDANSQWDDIKALKVKNFKLKNDVASGTKIGVIAQDLETASMSGLVEESNPMKQNVADHSDFGTIDEDGNFTEGQQVKSVKYSVLYMKAIKALQEAQTRIETLEAKVAVLEG